MSKRRTQKDTDTDDADQVYEWPGKQAPTTQLSLFETNFVKKENVALPAGVQPFEQRFVIQTTLDRYVEPSRLPR